MTKKQSGGLSKYTKVKQGANVIVIQPNKANSEYRQGADKSGGGKKTCHHKKAKKMRGGTKSRKQSGSLDGLASKIADAY